MAGSRTANALGLNGMQACVSRLAPLLGLPHRVHALHDPERPWPQTNCSVDLLIELVAAHGGDPVWMLAFTITQDFLGDHFTFFKVPNEDCEALYGLCVQELAVWDDLQDHVVEQVQRDHVVLLEVDGYFLPDTQGVTYRETHGKTTIGIFAIDPKNRRLAYFHNETRGLLEGDDYDGALQRLPSQSAMLMPYTEFICPHTPAPEAPEKLALRQLRHHWQRRPANNPFRAYAQVFPDHVDKLKTRGQAYFHGYAFNTLRQAGANFGLLESFLAALPDPGLAAAAVFARQLADGAKTLQFQLARGVVRNRLDGLEPAVGALADTYDALISALAAGLDQAGMND